MEQAIQATVHGPEKGSSDMQQLHRGKLNRSHTWLFYEGQNNVLIQVHFNFDTFFLKFIEKPRTATSKLHGSKKLVRDSINPGICTDILLSSIVL